MQDSNQIKLKNLNSTARRYDEWAFSSLDFTWLWRNTCLLLLISMLWHRQAIFESKGDKLSASVECRIRTWKSQDTFSPADCMRLKWYIGLWIYLNVYNWKSGSTHYTYSLFVNTIPVCGCLNLNHVSRRGPGCQYIVTQECWMVLTHSVKYTTMFDVFFNCQISSETSLSIIACN